MTRIASDIVNSVAFATAPATPTSVPTDGQSPELLPDPQVHRLESSGDVGAMVAALLMEMSKSSREIARSSREAATAAEDAAHAQKIEHMKDAAESKFIGGLTSGGLTVGSSALAVGGEMGRNEPVAKSAKSLEGGSAIAGAITNFSASNSDVEKEHADRALTQAKRNVESAGDMDKDAKDLLRRAMSHYAEYVRAKDDASKAALFRA